MTRLGFCKRCLVLGVAAVATFGGANTHAQAGRVIDKGRAAEIAQEKFGGELFGKIKKITASDGSAVFEVRLDTKGHVDIILVDSKGRARQKK